MTTDTDTPVQIEDEAVATWSFGVPGDSTTCGEATSEFGSLCEDLVRAFGDDLVPYEMKLRFRSLPEDQPLPASPSDLASAHRGSLELSDESGVDRQQFRTAHSNLDNGVPWLSSVEFGCLGARVTTADGERVIDRTSDYVADSSGEHPEQGTIFDPIGVRARYDPNLGSFDLDADYLYKFDVSAYSTIWLDDADAANGNRARLAGLLRRIYEALREPAVRRDSDWFPVEDLEAVY